MYITKKKKKTSTRKKSWIADRIGMYFVHTTCQLIIFLLKTAINLQYIAGTKTGPPSQNVSSQLLK